MDTELRETTPPLRQGLKRLAGYGLAACLPRARYPSTLLVLSHMRSTSTALTNVLCAHPRISGYGESHVPHHAPRGAGRLAANILRHGAWSVRSDWQCDKVLHNALDAQPGPGFYTARAVFLVRAPGPAIRSILRLAQRGRGLAPCTAQQAAAYYAARLEQLGQHWRQFPATHRFGLVSEHLRRDPDLYLYRIGLWLDLRPTLRNGYHSHPARARSGAGDPLRAAWLSRIVSDTPDTPCMPAGLPIDLIERCDRAYLTLTRAFAHPQLTDGPAPSATKSALVQGGPAPDPTGPYGCPLPAPSGQYAVQD